MTTHLTEQQIDTLLDHLASDDEFRQAFQQAPRDAMASIGLVAADDANVSNEPINQLASKETIAASRDEMRQSIIVGYYPYIPVTLDVAP
jgi:putative modified peptide